MEFFGLTLFGVSDPIKFLMRPDFKEPDEPPDMIKIVEKGDYKRPFNELRRDLDIHSGIMDGYSYRSYHRLRYTRDRGFYKPIGPRDMYKDPITGAIEYGWCLEDPYLKDKTWYKNDSFWPKQWSDNTRFLESAKQRIRNFVM